MNRPDERQIREAEQGLRALEAFWMVRLPETFGNLYRYFLHPFVAPCEFFSLDAILKGAGRDYGMLPQFLPFGKAVGDGGIYGFYVTHETELGNWPVLYWDEDEMFLRPVASEFDTFLQHCVWIGRYELEEQWPDDVPDWEEEEERREYGRLLHLPDEVLFGSIPRNDTELYERLTLCDSQDALSLCHLGCTRRMRGDIEKALDFYHRASEATPWFGDPLYLMADAYLDRDQMERAVQCWWAVLQRLLPLCTRTWEWNLGEEHPEADIYEVAADGVTQFESFAESAWKSDPLWQVVVHEDPYDPDARENLGNRLRQQRDFPGAEREYLSALSLCCTERGRQPERLYDALIALYEQQGRKRDAALARFDRALPRQAV
jgi:hypothetical protein